jgi:quercetin 2,3-dioxygenase
VHFHDAEDEWFQVVEGMFDILVGNVEHRLAPGDSILGPARIPHAFTNVTETGRLLLVFAPAGRMEEFFRTVGAMESVSPQVFAQVSADHGMTVTGPPLSPRAT